MPTKQTLELIEKIQTDLAALAGASIDSLVRQGDLGTAMSFEPLSGEFEGMTNLAAQLRSVDLASFPLQRLQRLAGFISALLVDLEKVKTFNPTTANATEQRQQLMASVTQNYSKLLDDATPFLTVGLMRTANLKAAVDSINTELARAKASHQKVEEVLKESTAVLDTKRQHGPG
jgi:hypothetical protein